MRRLGAVATVGAVEIRRRIRDRSFPLQAIVGPVVIAVIVALAFSGVRGDQAVTIGVVDADGSLESQQLVAGMITVADDLDGITLVEVDSRDDARDSIDRRGGAAVVVPAGFAANVRVAEPEPFEVLADGDSPIHRAVAESIAGDLATRFTIDRIVVAGLFESGGDVPVSLIQAALGRGTTGPVLDAAPIDDWDPLTYFAPSMALMFLFFAIGGVARSLLTDRRLGVLPRLLAAPVPSSALLWGRGTASLILAVVGMSSVLAVVGIVFGADLGPLRWTLPVLLAAATTVAGLGALIAGLARTDAQADAWTTFVAFGLALAGGAFVSPGDLPDALETLGAYTPNGRALQTYVDLVAGAAGSAEAIRSVGVLLAFTAVTGGLGLLLQRRKILS